MTENSWLLCFKLHIMTLVSACVLSNQSLSKYSWISTAWLKWHNLNSPNTHTHKWQSHHDSVKNPHRICYFQIVFRHLPNLDENLISIGNLLMRRKRADCMYHFNACMMSSKHRVWWASRTASAQRLEISMLKTFRESTTTLKVKSGLNIVHIV